MKYTNIINKIKANKRILYLSFCMVLILFSLVLNITFSLMTKDNNASGANITIGDMSYLFEINKDFPDLKSDIYNDRVIKLKAGLTQRYYVTITAQNKYSTKYELNYKVCASYDENTNTCTYADSLPSGVKIAYAYNTPSPVKGSIDKEEKKIITLYTDNITSKDVYLELSMNAGYIHNELKVLGSNYNLITEEFENPQEQSIEIKSIIAYANGEEVESYEFPSHGNFSLKMTCYDKDGKESTTAHADGYWSGTEWVVNVNSATENTICYAKFTTTTTPLPNFQYLVNGTDVSTNSAYVKTIDDGDGNWRIKFFESGTFIMSYPDVNYIDVFVVGGGGGGGGVDAGGYWAQGSAGGAGGYTNTCRYSDELNSKLISINKDTNYSVVIGAGGTAGKSRPNNTTNPWLAGGNGGTSSGFNCSAAGGNGAPINSTLTGANGGTGGGGGGLHYDGGTGGSNGGSGGGSGGSYGVSVGGGAGGSGQGTTTREFGESTGDLYAGGGGGGGGGNGGGGSYGTGTSGTKNSGGGGGGSACSSTAACNAGGSGIVIIRNHRT